MTARILVVDDVPANNRLLSTKLEQEYYDVATAVDGYEAIAKASAWMPDVILLDVMMPGMDGYETCRRLKSDPAIEHVPVVIITALGDPAERVRGLEAGADDFLTKPVEYHTLFARVRGLVRLKRLLDEWRMRERTMRDLGLSAGLPEAPVIDGRHVLIVDDRDIWSASAQASLTREGLLVQVAHNADAARAALAFNRFDLLVLSLTNSGEDSLRFAAKLRADPYTAELPLLLVADPDEPDRLLRGFEIGANDWLARPVDLNELRLRARTQIRRKLYQEQLRSDLTEALQLALFDQMTGLHNRRYLMRHLTGMMDGRQTPGIAALMIDVDHFKEVNDRWGHRAGDVTLRFIANILRDHIRAFDSLARYGGEEFVVVMPGATSEEAWTAAERLRLAIQASSFFPNETTLHHLTVSIGVARTTNPHTTPEQLLHSADLALYAAKRAGRNQTVIADVLT